MEPTPKSAYLAIADVLEKRIDSHSIYDVDLINKRLAEAGFTGTLQGFTHSQMWGQIENRGLGGELEKDRGIRYIGGYQVSDRVISALGLPYSQKNGRGFRHRDNIRIIRENANA